MLTALIDIVYKENFLFEKLIDTLKKKKDCLCNVR